LKECREFGWFQRDGAPCNPDEPGACEDLNRLAAGAVWDKEKKRWVRKRQPKKNKTKKHKVVAV
jgi:hypothetical protein